MLPINAISFTAASVHRFSKNDEKKNKELVYLPSLADLQMEPNFAFPSGDHQYGALLGIVSRWAEHFSLENGSLTLAALIREGHPTEHSGSFTPSNSMCFQ